MLRKALLAGLAAVLVLLPSALAAQTLRGSPASVDRIHRQALNHNLRFFETASAVREAHRRGELIRLEGNANYTLVDVSYPFVLPAAHTFVERLAAQYRSACGERLVVTSATRPRSLRLVNSVAKSVHPTGMAIDLRRPANSRCLNWLRSTLLALEAAGVIEAVEERNPPHFHVAVFPSQYNQYVQGRSGGILASAPSNTSRPPSTQTAQAVERYRVRQGDSLWTIARRNNVSVERLKEANNLTSTRILAGQTLVIPTAR
jgi:LysM repeat protein